jgi:hypothetical protein
MIDRIKKITTLIKNKNSPSNIVGALYNSEDDV